MHAWTSGSASLNSALEQSHKQSNALKVHLKRHVGVLAANLTQVLGAQQLEVLAYTHPRLSRVDNVVHKAALGCEQGVGKLLGVVEGLLLHVATAEDDLHRALRAHHCDLSGGPRVVEVAAEVLRAHDVVGTAVGLSRDHGHLGDGSLRVGEEELGAVADDAIVLLISARQKARDVDEGKDGDVERVGEAHETGRLHGRIDIEAASEVERVIGDDRHRAPLHPRKASDDIFGGVGHYLEERVAVHHLVDDRAHIISYVGVVGHQMAKRRLHTIPHVLSLHHRPVGLPAQRKVVEELTGRTKRFDVILERAVGDAR
mmetsp:Transcript_36681/g.98317  ORF Transcript_36681/g.98317 Transcript_36681/m.98317 type:complete len:315 (-) Transcript_36681:866-1810(-)